MSRILLTTRCHESGLYDYFRETVPRDFCWRFGMPRRISFGLRFLRQMFPAFPSSNTPRAPSTRSCRVWDAVGFSFYLEETIVTPQPQTEMWRDLESNCGIFEKDWSKFDTKHLVWNHLHCAPAVFETLLESFQYCYGSRWVRRTMKKFVAKRWFDFTGVLTGPLSAAGRPRIVCLSSRCARPLFPSNNRNEDTLQPFNLNVWKQRSSRGT